MKFQEHLNSFVRLDETTLAGKATDGRTAIQKYVTDNPKALEIDWETEANRPVPVYDKDGNELTTVDKGQKFKLLSTNVVIVNKKTSLDTELGFIQTRFIKKPSGFRAMSAEIAATNELNTLIMAATEEFNGPITLRVGKWNLENVVSASAEHIKGDPKADIAIFNEAGREVGFISHKKVGGAKAFQQYGGISDKAGVNHPEIDAFTQAVYDDTGDVAPNKYAVYREVVSKDLINMSVYGPNYGGNFGRENVHCIGQGTPSLKRIGVGYYALIFSDHMHINGDVRWAMKGDYKAVFFAVYKASRKITTRNGQTIRNARGGMGPWLLVKNRRDKREI